MPSNPSTPKSILQNSPCSSSSKLKRVCMADAEKLVRIKRIPAVRQGADNTPSSPPAPLPRRSPRIGAARIAAAAAAAATARLAG